MGSRIHFVAMIVTVALAGSLAPAAGSSPAVAQEQPPPTPPQSTPSSSEQSGPVAGCDVMHLGVISTEFGVFVDSADGPCPSGNQAYPHTGVFEFELTSEYGIDISLETQEGADRYLSLSDARGQVLAVGEVGGPIRQDRTSADRCTWVNYSCIETTLPAGTYRIEAATSEPASDYGRPGGAGGFLIGIYAFATAAPTSERAVTPDLVSDTDTTTPSSQPVPGRTDCGSLIAFMRSLHESLCNWSSWQEDIDQEDIDCDKPTGDKYKRERKGNPFSRRFGTAEHHVKAKQDFTTIDGERVSKDDWGGEVEHKGKNLSQWGCSWITDGAKANNNTTVKGNALVKDSAEILNQASVSGNAQVYGDSRVYDNAEVSGNAQVYGRAKVYGNAKVSGSARITGNAKVYGETEVAGNAHIFGDMEIESDVYDGIKEYKRIAIEMYDMAYDEVLSSLIDDCPGTISIDDLRSLAIELLKEGTPQTGSVNEAIQLGCNLNRFYKEAREALSVTGWELFVEFALPVVKNSGLKRLSQVAELLEIAQSVRDAHDVSDLADTLDGWGISQEDLDLYDEKVREEYKKLTSQ